MARNYYLLFKGTAQSVMTLWVLIFCMSSVASANSGITYHGKILKPDGLTPVTSATTQFRIQIRTPGSENCLLWEEQQTKDLSASAGVFSLTISDTTEPTLIPNALPYSLDRVFSNRTNFAALTNCSVGNSYNPTASDGRVLQVMFREVPTDPWELMPVTRVNFVPLALNSVQLEGYRANEFLKIDPLSAYTPLTAANVNTLVDIIAGTSNQYLKPATAFSGDVSGTYNATSVDKIKGISVVGAPANGQVLKYNGTNWVPAADDNNASPADASYTVKGVVQINTDLATSGLFIAGGVLALPNVITAGGPTGNAQTVPVITYDQKGRLTAVSTATIDDTTKLPLAGGTMTGNINMGGHDVTNAANVAATNVSVRNVVLNDNDTNTVTIKTPADIAANYSLTLPLNDGASGEVLSTDGNGVLSWVSASAGSVTNVSSANNYLTVTNPNTTPVLTVNVGTTANTVAAGDDARITGALQTATYDADVLPAASCTTSQTPYWNSIAGTWACQNINVAATGAFVDGGNTFTATATLGTNSNHNLEIETNGTTKMTITNSGNVGIGKNNPAALLDVNGRISSTGHDIAGYPLSGNYSAVDIGIDLGTDANLGSIIGSDITIDNWGVYSPHTISKLSGATAVVYQGRSATVTDGYGGEFTYQALSGTTTNAYGMKGQVYNPFVNGGAATNAYGVYGNVSNGGSANLFTNSYGGHFSVTGGASSSTNSYGLYVGTVTGANKWSIYSNDSSAPSYFSGKVGIGTTSPATKLDVAGGIKIGTEASACAAGLAGSLRYNGGAVEYCNGTSWQAFGVSGAGLTSLGGQTGNTQTFAAGSAGNSPAITSASDVHTLNVPLASSGASITSGTISNAEYVALNAKLTSPLTTKGDLLTRDGTTHVRFPVGTDGQVLVVDPAQTSGLKWATLSTGTVTNVSSGNNYLTVTTPSTTPVITANVGTAANTLAAGDDSRITGALQTTVYDADVLPAASCTTSQTPYWSTVAGTWLCQNISASASGAFVNGGNTFTATATIGTNSNHNLEIETNGTTKMTVLANGDVGIGTTTPTHSLDVVGGVNTDTAYYVGGTAYMSSVEVALNNGTSATFKNNNSTGGSYTNVIGGASNSSYLNLQSTTANGTTDSIRFTVDNNGGTEAMRIINNGNVGIGTTNPAAQLQINTGATSAIGQIIKWGQASQTANLLEFQNNSGSILSRVDKDGKFYGDGSGLTGVTAIPAGTTGQVQFNSGSSTMAADSEFYWDNTNKRLGLGTTAPGAKVHAFYYDTTAYNPTALYTRGGMFANYSNTGVNGTFSNIGFLVDAAGGSVNTGAGYINLIQPTSGLSSSAMSFQVGNVTSINEIMRLTSSGNVGIGTTNPGSNLDVSSSAASAASNLRVLNSNFNSGVSLDAYWPGISLNSYHNGTNKIALGTGYSGGFNMNPSTGAMSIFRGNNPGTGAVVSESTLIGINNDSSITMGNGSTTSKVTISRGGNDGYATTSATLNSPAANLILTNPYADSTNNSVIVFETKNASNNIQRGYVGTYSQNGAAAYTPHLIFGMSTGAGAYSEKMRIENTGNVGIGTTTPGTTLDVNGAISQRGMAAPAVSAAGQGRIYFDSTSNTFKASQNGGAYSDLITSVSSSGGFVQNGNSFGAQASLGTNDDQKLVFETNNTIRMAIGGSADAGHVSIGNAFPSSFDTLFVGAPDTASNLGGVGSGISIREEITGSKYLNMGVKSGAAGYSWIQSLTNDPAAFPLVLNASGGNVGIGTTAPLLKSDTRGSNLKATTAAVEYISQVGSTDATGPLVVRTGVKTHALASNRYGVIDVDDNGSKRNLVLQPSNGAKVGIGTTSPDAILTLDSNGSNDLLTFKRAGTTVARVDEWGVVYSDGYMAGSGTQIGSRMNLSDSGTTWDFLGGYYQDDENVKAFGIMNGTYSTTPAQSFRFWQLNSGVGRINNGTSPDTSNGISMGTNGNVGIGVTSPGTTLDVNGAVNYRGAAGGAGGIALSPAGQGRIYFDSSSNTFKVSQNGSAFTDLVSAGGGGDITDVVAGAGLTGGATSGSVTVDIGAGTGIVVNANDVAVDVGTAVGKIVQVQTGGRLPALDGSDLTNLDAGDIATGVLAIARGGTNSTTALTNGKVMVSSAGSIIEGNASNTAKSNNTFVMRDGSGNIAAALGTFDQLAMNGSVAGTLNITAPSSFTNWSLTLPTTAGSAGQVLSTNGSGVTSWVAQSAGAPATSVAAATVNFASSNFAYTSQNCQTFALWNLKDGSSYSFAVQGTVSATCSFNAFSDGGNTSLAVKMPPDHTSTTVGTQTLYSFMVMGTTVYVSWVPGY